MAEGFGGPVWHASARAANERESIRLARMALTGVGDAQLGEWVDTEGMGRGIVHVQRRLTEAERDAYGVPDPFDIRGTAEEERRLSAVVEESPPQVRVHLERIYGRTFA